MNPVPKIFSEEILYNLMADLWRQIVGFPTSVWKRTVSRWLHTIATSAHLASQSLERGLTASLWRPPLSTWMTRRCSGAVSMDSLKEIMLNQPVCLLWCNSYLDGGWASSGDCQPQFLQVFQPHLSLHLHRQTQELGTGWIDNEVHWELVEWETPEGLYW